MGFREWIVPQDRHFYDLLEKQIAKVDAAAAQLESIVKNWKDLEAERVKLRGIEHEADEIAHELFDLLNRSFITPIDREDIAALTRTMDDIIDYIYASGNRMVLYELAEPTPAIHTMLEFLRGQIRQLIPAVQSLRRARDRKIIAQNTPEIHRLENEADRLLSRSVAALFKAGDPIQIMKLKEIYETMEIATDRCEDVADVLNDILRKHG